jgi:DNA replication protein DnaC
MITSNLVFSKWDQIFKDPMTTAAAIDRVVHHAVVLEFTGPSARAEAAEQRAAKVKRDTTADDRAVPQ